MNDNSDILPNLHHEEFEMQMRGYSRRQVDEYVARRNNEIRDLEQRLAHALDEAEHLRREISVVRQQALAGRPAHEEISERMAQILKLAEDEAKAQRSKTEEEVTSLRAEAQRESERVRTDAREQAERMLNAAQEQAERTISAARAEAEKLRGNARNEVEQLTSESRKQADATLAEAKAQAQRMVEEATARASAIHDGAERRLSLLSTRHAETVRRLTDILEGVQGLVAAESARMSLEDEVSQSASTAIAALEPSRPATGTGPGQTAPSGQAKEPDHGTVPPRAPEAAENGASAPAAAGPESGPQPSVTPAAIHPVTVHPVTVHRDLPSSGPGTGPAVTPGAGETAQPTGSAQPGGPAQPGGTAQPTGPAQPGGTGQPGGTAQPGGTPGPARPAGPGTAGPVSTGPADVPGAASGPETRGTQPAVPAGRHASTQPSPPAMPRRLNVPPTDNSAGNSRPAPGPIHVGQSPPPPNGYPSRETQPESHHTDSYTGPGTGPSGLIDPDEPTEGFRLMR